MSITWTVLGTFFQLMLAYFMFLLAVFAGAGVANGNTFSQLQMTILNLSMFALPGACAASAAIVLWLHWHGSGASAYWWHALPFAAAALYIAFVVSLGSQP